MAYFSAWLLKRSSIAKTSLVNSIGFYILVMMAAMFIGAILYFSLPTAVGVAEALGLNMVVMSVGVIAVLHYWTKDDREIEVSENLPSSEDLGLQRSIVISRAYVVYFLVMMASMTAVGIIYIINTAITGLEEGLILGNIVMIPGVVAVLWYASKHPGETKEPAYKNNSSIGFGGGTLISLVLLNEFVMGWTFIDASGSSAFTGNSLSNILGALSYVSGSDWFLFTLSFEILFTIYMLHGFFSKDFIKIACLQSLITIFVPTAIGSRLWSTVSIIADIVILSGLLILLSMNSQTGSHSVKNYLRLLIILDSLVVAGSLIWVVEGNALLLLPLLIAEVVLYFNAILERVNMGKDRSATSLVPELSGTGSL